MRPLGTVQRAVLWSLVQHGNWHTFYTCGWTWAGDSVTTRIMESLVRHGLVQKEHKAVTRNGSVTRDVYTPTQAGIDLVNTRS